MQLRKRILIPLIVLGTVGIWLSQHGTITATQQAIEELRTEMTVLTNRIQTASLELASSHDEFRQQKSSREELRGSVTKAERELASISPESRWAAVPSDLPEWNSDSPYVWVRKEVMKEVPAEPFAEDGSLLPQAAPILAIDPPQLRKLNNKLKRILGEYQRIESTNVVLTDEHLLGAGPVGKGKVITICWEPSDEGARLKGEYEAALREALGEQRTELLLAVDWDDLSSKFGRSRDNSEAKKKTTVVRHPNGGFNIAVDRGTSSFSTSVSKADQRHFEQHIPQHVRHFFAELLDATDK